MTEITQYDSEMLKIVKDPVKWAKVHLKSDDPKDKGPRWYQEQILRHPHNRKVLRCGRRIGKCIEENQRVLIENGEYVPIRELFLKQHKGIEVISLGEKLENTPSPIFQIEDNGLKESFKVTTRRGNEVILTENHPLLTIDGWVEVKDLVIGDMVATPKEIPYFGKDVTRSDNFIKLLGYLTTSCSYLNNVLTLEIKSDDILSDIQRICNEEELILIQKTEKLYFLINKNNHEAVEIFKNSNNDIPKEVYSYSKEKLSIFISAIYDSQGWRSAGKTPEIGYGSRNKEFLNNLSHLLLRFGIRPSIIKRQVNGSIYYQLMIYKINDIRAFMKFFSKSAFKDYTAVYQLANSKEDAPTLVPRGKALEEEILRKNIKIRKTDAKTIQEDKLLHLSKKYKSQLLYEMATSDVYYDKIVNIENVGARQTYDVFVPETHNLIVEDMYVHNTWTMVAHMLWVAFTCNGGKDPKGATCVVATPYDTQARLIYDELIGHITRNQSLKESVESTTKNPYFIKFKNGSVIKLFTAGTKSGSAGGSLRGQKATWLYMDKTLSLYIVRCIENLVNSGKP